MPAFTDLDKAEGVAKLNDFLASASFVDGYVPRAVHSAPPSVRVVVWRL